MKNDQSGLIVWSLFISVLLVHGLGAAEYFIDGNTGNDASSGTSETTPKRSLYNLNSILRPGDTITYLNGTHLESWRRLEVSGSATQPILIRAKNPRQAILKYDPAHATTILHLQKVNYVTIEGLVIDGGGSSDSDGFGIVAENVHHITVRNCRVKDCGGGGIGAVPYTSIGTGQVQGPCDFITIEDNDVSGCGFWNTYQTSGISIYQARSAGLGTAPGGFNIIVRRNKIWGCANKVTTWGSTNPADFKEFSVTDGNGIIIDDFHNSQGGGGYPIFPHKTLIENNISFGNGGRGVHVYESDHVTVRNNTAWGNCLQLPGNWKAELSNIGGDDNVWYNNIGIATAQSLAASGQGIVFTGSASCAFSKNLIIGPTFLPEYIPGTLSAAEIIAANVTTTTPFLVNPSYDAAVANFQLQAGSICVNGGDSIAGRYAATDILGVARPQAAKPDIGAYEYTSGAPTNTAPLVNAGADKSVTFPASVSLTGTATDDGLPAPASLNHQWTKTSGPGAVNFSAPTSLTTTATFSVNGIYVLRLTTTDTALPGFDEVTVTSNAVPTNSAPVVNAGVDKAVTLPSTVSLTGTATDDGLPSSSTLTHLWTKFSGPGTVTFTPATALTTTAGFGAAGIYVLRLITSDGLLSGFDDVTVIVNPAPTPSVVTGLSYVISGTAPDSAAAVKIIVGGVATAATLAPLTGANRTWTVVITAPVGTTIATVQFVAPDNSVKSRAFNLVR